MQTVHDTSKSKLDKLTERLKSQETTITMLEGHLVSSKQREEALEFSLKRIADEKEEKKSTESSGTSQQSQHVEEEEEGVVHEHKEQQSYQLISQLLKNSQTRCRELEGQLVDAKANMDELIVEIEGVATEEERTRTQNARLLKQISEGHNVHKAVLQENLRLHQDITSLQEKESLALSKSAIPPPPLSPHLFLFV
jgi:type I site-specific restriction-modification system R (restriction) subunit